MLRVCGSYRYVLGVEDAQRYDLAHAVTHDEDHALAALLVRGLSHYFEGEDDHAANLAHAEEVLRDLSDDAFAAITSSIDSDTNPCAPRK